jgi:hypothetical protein
MGAVGALAGPSNLLLVFILDALIAGLAALLLVVVRGRLWRTLRNIAAALGSLVRGRAPYKDNVELDAGHPRSLGLPRAVTIMTATLLLLWATPSA